MNSFLPLLKKLVFGKIHSKPQKKFKPKLECFEERIVPTFDTFYGTYSSDGTNAANWSSNPTLPSAAMDIQVDAAIVFGAAQNNFSSVTDMGGYSMKFTGGMELTNVDKAYADSSWNNASVTVNGGGLINDKTQQINLYGSTIVTSTDVGGEQLTNYGVINATPYGMSVTSPCIECGELVNTGVYGIINVQSTGAEAVTLTVYNSPFTCSNLSKIQIQGYSATKNAELFVSASTYVNNGYLDVNNSTIKMGASANLVVRGYEGTGDSNDPTTGIDLYNGSTLSIGTANLTYPYPTQTTPDTYTVTYGTYCDSASNIAINLTGPSTTGSELSWNSNLYTYGYMTLQNYCTTGTAYITGSGCLTFSNVVLTYEVQNAASQVNWLCTEVTGTGISGLIISITSPITSPPNTFVLPSGTGTWNLFTTSSPGQVTGTFNQGTVNGNTWVGYWAATLAIDSGSQNLQIAW